MVLELCLVHAFGSTLLQKDVLLPYLPHMLVLMELKLLGVLRTSSHMHQLEGLSHTLRANKLGMRPWFFYFRKNLITFNHFLLNVSYMYVAKLELLEQCYFLRHPDKTWPWKSTFWWKEILKNAFKIKYNGIYILDWLWEVH